MNSLNRWLTYTIVAVILGVLSSSSAKANDGDWLAKLDFKEGGLLCLITEPILVPFTVTNGLISGTINRDGATWAYQGNVQGNNINVQAMSQNGDRFQFSGGIVGNVGAGVWSSSFGCAGPANYRKMN